MTVEGELIDELRSGFAGAILESRDRGYDLARQSFNAMIDRRPAVIAQPADAAEVVRAVLFARDHDLPIAVLSLIHI